MNALVIVLAVLWVFTAGTALAMIADTNGQVSDVLAWILPEAGGDQ